MNLNQVTVPSLDLTNAILFYVKLGLKLIVESLPDYARFECTNLDEYVNELIKKGIVFEQTPTNQKWLWREARLKDVDGNQFILFYGGKNRVNPPWKIKKS